MSDGITLSSGSIGATEEDIRRVLERNGHEIDEPDSEPAAKVPEPQPEPQVSMQQHWVNYLDSVQQFRKQYPDWDEVTNRPTPISQAVFEEVVAQEMPQLAYHLGRHTDFTEKLARMKPSEAVAQIRELAERLRPEKGVTYKGTTALKSGTRTQPASNRRPAPKTAAAAAAKGDYKAFKALQRQERGMGRLA